MNFLKNLTHFKLSAAVSEEDMLKNMGYKLIHQLAEGNYGQVFVLEELEVYSKLKGLYRFAELGNLLDYILENGAIEQNQARRWTRQMALGIQYLHILGIAHRDIKCENILLTANYNIKLSDFGLATFSQEQSLSETYCGTTVYASPEIVNSQPYNAKAADMWSFGIVIFAMLNRRNPFSTKNLKMLYREQIHKKWMFRMVNAERFSEEVKSLIGHLLEPEVLKRYKIDEVLNSSWIAMDSKLKVLSPPEFAALSRAMEEAKCFEFIKVPERERSGRFSSAMKKINQGRKSCMLLKCTKSILYQLLKTVVVFFKKYDTAFDLQHISILNTEELENFSDPEE